MHHLIAKVKTRNKQKLFKVFSESEPVFDIDTDSLGKVDYEVDHRLDEDSWFKINEFSEQDYCLDLIKKDFVDKEYFDLSKDDFTKISYICSVQNEDMLFQKISTSTSYLKKKFIAFGDVAHLEKSKTRLCINQYPDAIYLRKSDTLLFRKLATISSIFPGIDTLYKEATKEEVQEFLANDFLELTDGYNLDKVSKPNRARIALAMDTLAEMGEDKKSEMLDYIQKYCGEKLDFDTKSDNFKIKTDEQLKFLLYGIEERFYTTQLGQERRLANSVQTLTKKDANLAA